MLCQYHAYSQPDPLISNSFEAAPCRAEPSRNAFCKPFFGTHAAVLILAALPVLSYHPVLSVHRLGFALVLRK
jgi:hypothetical protein